MKSTQEPASPTRARAFCERKAAGIPLLNRRPSTIPTPMNERRRAWFVLYIRYLPPCVLEWYCYT